MQPSSTQSASQNYIIALAGQPNCGKSTIFNLLTGARQHVANYPGVTVEKLTGAFSIGQDKITLVDLPGTYAFTSYSPEERAARDFILNDCPDAVVAVVDASTLEKGMYFLLQLLQMGRPVIVALNMMDVAERRGLYPDTETLSQKLGVPVITLQAAKGIGRKELCQAISDEVASDTLDQISFDYSYGPLDNYLTELSDVVSAHNCTMDYPARWVALKLLEKDSAVIEAMQSQCVAAKGVIKTAEVLRDRIEIELQQEAIASIAATHHKQAREISDAALDAGEAKHLAANKKITVDSSKPTFTERVDSVVCHRILGPICLVGVLYLFYVLSVTYGNMLAAEVWPFWASFEDFCASIMPHEGFLTDPLLTSLGVWVVKSITAVLNYLPIFLIMFAFVAILEDSGYLARIAFVLDRVFRTYGLHGQSTLPLILGGVYVGGCAIPGVIATRAIPDERARFTTIMIVPMMNCLAKVPLYFLLIGGFFAAEAGSTMFFMGTVTLLMGLITAKVLSLTILRGRPSAPFIIELPAYHMPTFRGVVHETFLRIWVFIKKILTVVIAVSIVVFALVTFPGLSTERMDYYTAEQQAAEQAFVAKVSTSGLAGQLTEADILPLIRFQNDLRTQKRGVSKEQAAAINEKALQDFPVYASVALRKGPDGKALSGALKTVDTVRKNLRRELRQERFENSFLGQAGKALESFTAPAGFTWRINVALLSALAAKENSAATLGALYGFDGSGAGDAMRSIDSQFTPLHALALMLFMALYPPCLPAAMMVRAQTGGTKWMLFSIVFQLCVGLFVATLVFSGGTYLGLSGTEAMWTFYSLCIALVVILGFVPDRRMPS